MAMDMKNCLDELRRGTKVQVVAEENDPVEFELEECLAFIDKISQQISEIEALFERINAAHSNVVSSVGNDKEIAMERHAKLMEQMKQLFQQVIKGLKRLDDEIKSSEKGPERNSAEVRIKKSQYSALNRRVKNIMMDYNKMEEEHADKMKDIVRRQLKTLGKTDNLTEEKLEEMVESKDQLFTQDILVDTARKREDLRDIEKRKREILKLEENICDLNEMFYDMMLLVEDQDDLVDSIEHHVERTSAHVAKAAQSTAVASRYKRSNRKLQWIICLVVSLVAGVLLIVIGIIVAAIVGIQGNN